MRSLRSRSSACSAADWAGSVGANERVDGTPPGRAEGTPGRADGTPGRADGTPGRADGTSGRAEGTDGGIEAGAAASGGMEGDGAGIARALTAGLAPGVGFERRSTF